MSARTSTVQESGQIVPMDQGLATIRQMLGQNAKGIGALLGDFMPAERFCGAVLTLCRQNPDLTDHNKASRQSLLLAVLRIAHLRLSPDPALGQAWVVPRKGRAEMSIGYRGYLTLAYRSPLVRAVRYNVVAKGEAFEWRDGRDFVLSHQPGENGWPEKMADILAAWAVIETTRGGEIPRVMFTAEILRHKARGAGAQPAWSTDPAPMAIKTVLADVCRRGPFEADVARAFALDHHGEIGKGQPKAEDEFLDVEFSVTDEGNGKAEGAAAAFKEAHRLEAPPEEVDLNRILTAEELDEIRVEAKKYKVGDALEAYLPRNYGDEVEVPVGDKGRVLQWVHDQAKGKR